MKRERKTKIIATLGQASNKPETIEALINAGADCFRINFSHVRSPTKIQQARRILGHPKIQIMSKFELAEAQENLDSILEESDGVMVSRGDLVVELDF